MNRKADFLLNESILIDSQKRIESNRELECSTTHDTSASSRVLSPRSCQRGISSTTGRPAGRPTHAQAVPTSRCVSNSERTVDRRMSRMRGRRSANKQRAIRLEQARSGVLHRSLLWRVGNNVTIIGVNAAGVAGVATLPPPIFVLC